MFLLRWRRPEGVVVCGLDSCSEDKLILLHGLLDLGRFDGLGLGGFGLKFSLALDVPACQLQQARPNSQSCTGDTLGVEAVL